jgi:hypothetical protein
MQVVFQKNRLLQLQDTSFPGVDEIVSPPIVLVWGSCQNEVTSRVPETEMIHNQGPKANLHDFNEYALQQGWDSIEGTKWCSKQGAKKKKAKRGTWLSGEN